MPARGKKAKTGIRARVPAKKVPVKAFIATLHIYRDQAGTAETDLLSDACHQSWRVTLGGVKVHFTTRCASDTSFPILLYELVVRPKLFSYLKNLAGAQLARWNRGEAARQYDT
jgi:hypothetical protein